MEWLLIYPLPSPLLVRVISRFQHVQLCVIRQSAVMSYQANMYQYETLRHACTRLRVTEGVSRKNRENGIGRGIERCLQEELRVWLGVVWWGDRGVMGASVLGGVLVLAVHNQELPSVGHHAYC